MTKDEALKIIEECRDWNAGQKSISFLMHGKKTAEDGVLDARRKALRKAWLVVGESEDIK